MADCYHLLAFDRSLALGLKTLGLASASSFSSVLISSQTNLELRIGHLEQNMLIWRNLLNLWFWRVPRSQCKPENCESKAQVVGVDEFFWWVAQVGHAVFTPFEWFCLGLPSTKPLHRIARPLSLILTLIAANINLGCLRYFSKVLVPILNWTLSNHCPTTVQPLSNKYDLYPNLFFGSVWLVSVASLFKCTHQKQKQYHSTAIGAGNL